LRIVAGTARRINLVSPKGLNTRPTSDIAKEGLFNILSTVIQGSRFLDLFCGSGAIGLEALSRGAKQAILVESSRHAIEATLQNIEKTRLAAQLMEMPVITAINKLSANNQIFDIIFLDPPYDTNILTEALQILSTTNLLAKNGTIIAETDIMHKETISLPDVFQLIDSRNYGRTCFLFFNWKAEV